MRILREPEVWQRPRPPKATRHASDLTPEEQLHSKAALSVLRQRLGSWKALAEALLVNVHTIRENVHRRGRPSAGLMLRASRIARVPLEDILSGAWPRAGACPFCGRCDEALLPRQPAQTNEATQDE